MYKGKKQNIEVPLICHNPKPNTKPNIFIRISSNYLYIWKQCTKSYGVCHLKQLPCLRKNEIKKCGLCISLKMAKSNFSRDLSINPVGGTCNFNQHQSI